MWRGSSGWMILPDVPVSWLVGDVPGRQVAWVPAASGQRSRPVACAVAAQVMVHITGEASTLSPACQARSETVR